jgi:hypothetical protein
MPAALIPAFAAAVGAAAAGTTLFGLSVAASAILVGVSSFALNGLAGAMAPKPKSTKFADFGAQSSNRTVQLRQAITYRRIVYGEVRVSGPLIFAGSTSKNKYLHLVIALAGHEVHAINEVWINDDVIPNDWISANGMVNSGKYSGKIRIIKHLGREDQTVDTTLKAEIPGWTSEHRGRGVAYLNVRLQFDADLFPTGTPNISAVVQGKPVLDLRTSARAWTPNPAFFSYDWITDQRYGCKALASDINDDQVIAAANANEEIVNTQPLDVGISAVNASTDIVTLKGTSLQVIRGDRVRLSSTVSLPTGITADTDYYVIPYQFNGTPRIKLAASMADAIDGAAINLGSAGSGTMILRKNGEPRYFGGGSIEGDSIRAEGLKDILSAMGGTAVNIGGSWSIFSAVYRSPSITYDEGQVRAPITVQTRLPRRDRFNTVKGLYSTPTNSWQPADYPVVTDGGYRAADGDEELTAELDQPFTQRIHQAQRLAQIKLRQNRREISMEMPCKLHGLQSQPADTVFVNNSRFGFNQKTFEVSNLRIINEEGENGGAPLIGVDLGLRETDANIYSWSSGNEASADIPPRSELPNAFSVDPPIGLSINSIRISTLEDDSTFRVVLSWQPHEDTFVIQGGYYQANYKKSSDLDWLPVGGRIEGSETRADLFTGELGTLYDVQLRVFNVLGVPSVFQTLSGFIVGSAGGVSDTEDHGSFSEAASVFEDHGSFSEAASVFEDHGSFTA